MNSFIKAIMFIVFLIFLVPIIVSMSLMKIRRDNG